MHLADLIKTIHLIAIYLVDLIKTVHLIAMYLADLIKTARYIAITCTVLIHPHSHWHFLTKSPISAPGNSQINCLINRVAINHILQLSFLCNFLC